MDAFSHRAVHEQLTRSVCQGGDAIAYHRAGCQLYTCTSLVNPPRQGAGRGSVVRNAVGDAGSLEEVEQTPSEPVIAFNDRAVDEWLTRTDARALYIG